MAIDKSDISQPLRTSDPQAESIVKDERSPRQKVVDVIVSRLRQVDNYGRGVDLERVQPMCEQDLDQSALQLVKDAGGWPAFILANTDGKTIRSFKEGHRIIVLPGKVFDMQELRTGIENIIEREAENESIPESYKPFVAPEVTFDIPEKGKSVNGNGHQRKRSNEEVEVKPTKLTRQNEEVVELLPKLTASRKTEFFKDDARQSAMRAMRALTLLMRLRDVFQGRSYATIISRLEEEGDVKRLGGIEQLFEIGVRAGYLERKVKDKVVGHIATAKGAALIQPVTDESLTHSLMHDDSQLNQQLLESYEALRPTKDSDRVRAKIVREIQAHLDRNFPQAQMLVELFGSSGTGLYFPGSDSDVCAYYQAVPPPRTVEIRQLGNSFRRAHWCSNVFTVAFAKVPVVKMVHTASGLPLDISIENTIAIENTRLIKLYMDLDERVKPLAFALKVWCKSRSISHPEEGTLSSYSWILMLIHYLQRTQPPILPNLQARTQHAYEPFTHSYNGELIECFYDESPTFQSISQETVASLFVGFFRYFASFDFATLCVNVQPVFSDDGAEQLVLRKADKGRADWVNKAIAIQDPFIARRNTGVGCSPILADWTLNEIRRADRILQAGGSFADIVTFICP